MEAGSVDPDAAADVLMAASSVLAALEPEEVDPRSGRIAQTLASWAEQPNSLAVAPRRGWGGGDGGEPPAAGEAPLLVQAVLDPLSKPAQRLAPLLAFLREAFDPEMQARRLPPGAPPARPFSLLLGWRC